MPFAIPGANTATYAKQAEPSPADFRILSDATELTGVVSGCAVPSSASLVVTVPAGLVRIGGIPATVVGNTVTVIADPANPRVALVSVDSAGTAVVTHGAAAANPFAPDVPAASAALAMIHVPAASTAVATAQIIDKRVILDVDVPARYIAPTPAAAIANSTAELAFNRSYTVPADTLAVGQAIRLRMWGKFSSTATATTLTVRVRWGGLTGVVLLLVGPNTVAASAASRVWMIEGDMVVVSIGAAGTIEAHGQMHLFTTSKTQHVQWEATPVTSLVTGVNTTIDQALTVTGQWSVANVGHTITMSTLVVEVLT